MSERKDYTHFFDKKDKERESLLMVTDLDFPKTTLINAVLMVVNVELKC